MTPFLFGYICSYIWLGSRYKWNHILPFLLCVVYLTWHPLGTSMSSSVSLVSLSMALWAHPWRHSNDRKWRRAKEPLSKRGRGELKSCLKLSTQKTKIIASSPVTSWETEEDKWKQQQILFSWAPKSLWIGTIATKFKKCAPLGRKTMTNLDSILKSSNITDKDPYSQSYGFSSGHIWMWDVGHKEGWRMKNWCFSNCGAGEDSWESLGLQGDQTSQSWRKSILNIHWNDCCWSSNTLATWC